MTDLKEKENDIIGKIKSQIAGHGIDIKECIKFENGDVLSTKLIDLANLKALESKLTSEIDSTDSELNEELEKRKKYRVFLFFVVFD